MKTIQEIYTQYTIPKNLQEHMFRVTAVGEMIVDHCDKAVSRDEVIRTLLLHDMGNIIKFNLDHFPEFLEPEGYAYWQGIKEQFKEKYGNDEHRAHVLIARELGVSDRICELIHHVGFQGMCQNVATDDWAQKICNYADLRVYPHGVVPLTQRLEDGRKRYNIAPGDERWDLVTCAQELEDQIFEHCDIKSEDINDMAIAQYVAKYREFHL